MYGQGKVCLLFVFTNAPVFIKSQITECEKNLLNKINPKWDYIVSKNTCFQGILMGKEENGKANIFFNSKRMWKK